MRTTDIQLLQTRGLDIASFSALLEEHHIDTVVDGGVETTGDFGRRSLAELCNAQGFGYLPRGDQLDPSHAGDAAFKAAAGSIAELSRAGRVVVINPHSALPGVLEGMGLTVMEIDGTGINRPYQRHLDLD